MGRGSLGAGGKAADIKNKIKRVTMYQKSRKEGEKQARVNRKARQKEAEALGEDAPDRSLQQRTLDNTRDADDTVVQPGDEEIAAEDSFDEFSKHFAGEETPSIVVTTSQYPSKKLLSFMEEVIGLLPNAEYRQRGAIPIKAVVQAASKRGFTMLLVFTEGTGGGSAGKRSKVCQSLWMVKLSRPDSGVPCGPTARFKVSNVVMPEKLTGHGRPTNHRPELILNNFSTRLGHRVGRFLGCLVPHDPQFRGRQVVTMHNQRDFIFFRHHRYIFEEKGEGKKKRVAARLQELGPRFTLRLKSLQVGAFDTRKPPTPPHRISVSSSYPLCGTAVTILPPCVLIARSRPCVLPQSTGSTSGNTAASLTDYRDGVSTCELREFSLLLLSTCRSCSTPVCKRRQRQAASGCCGEVFVLYGQVKLQT